MSVADAKGRGLSDIALEWMCCEAQAKGLRIRDGHGVQVKPNPLGRIHESCDGLGGFLLGGCDERHWPFIYDAPIVHESVFVRKKSGYNPWILRDYNVRKFTCPVVDS